VKGICKNLVTPSKDQTWQSWSVKKSFKPKGYIIYEK
jgi:hypothetical protein